MSLPRNLHVPVARKLAATLLTLAVAACAAAPGPAWDGGATPRPYRYATCKPLFQAPLLLTSDDLETLQPTDLYESVRWFRPSFLRGRSPAHAVVVYVDGLKTGGIASLHDIAASDVAYVAFLSPADATTRFGTGHPGGVLFVRTHRGLPDASCPAG
jgi:hypothetical protein